MGNERNVIQMCTQCDDNNNAVNFCVDCKEYICTECTSAHKRTKLTKKHKLDNLHQEEADKTNAGTEPKPSTCLNKSHSDKEATLFCVDCSENICEMCKNEGHSEHAVESLEKLFIEKRCELEKLVSEIKQCDIQAISERLDNRIREQKDKSSELKNALSDQFQTYIRLLEEGRDCLKVKIEQITADAIKRFEMNKDLVQQGKKMLEEADILLKETNQLTFLQSSQNLLKDLPDIQNKIPNRTDVTDFRFNQACTTEDFNKIVQALGSVQVLEEEESEGGNSMAKDEHFPSDGSSQKEQLIEVLKSLTAAQVDEFSQMSYRSSKLHSSVTEPACSLNNETFTIVDVNKTKVDSIPNPASLIERNIPRGRQEIMRSNFVKDIVSLRFQTWGLQGHWKVEDGHVEMLSRTLEESEHCMQMLRDTVLEKTLSLSKGSEFIVESDKWQIITGNLKRKYPNNQIAIDVKHSEGQVVMYATCTTILNDTYDAIRIFLRDNQVKTVTLHYDEKIVKFVLRNKNSLEKIKNCFSQYCIEIKSVNNKNILIKGIGFGLGQAVRKVHEIAVKCSRAIEKDRFDSDATDGSDEDEPRFSDEEEETVADVDVQMTLIVEAGRYIAAIKAICFPGDDRMVYALLGDITELPVEALVNAADKTLKHNGGLAKALVQKGGRSIQEECTDYVQRNGNIRDGQVFCSGAGNLRCSVIIHAVGPKWIDGQNNEKEKLYECVISCLRNASRRRIASLAFPAISAGTFRFPLNIATLTIGKAVKDFFQEQPRCSIREVYLCDKAEDTVNEFANAIKETFRNCDIVFSNDKQAIQETEQITAERRDVRQLLVI